MVPVADYDTQTAALMGCSESCPYISKITCHENSMGIVGMDVEYFDGRVINSGDPTLATASKTLDMAPVEENHYVVFIEASRTDTQFGYMRFETNRAIGTELSCGVSRGPNEQ